MINVRTLTLLTLLGSSLPIGAQEVQWRTDYAAALKESQDKNLPLFVDCYTDNCYWCRRLDATFRDPAIVELLNGRFIPLKLDANRHENVVRPLEVHRFPTLIHAGPDATIFSMTEGFQDATALQANLRQTLERIAASSVAARTE